MVNTGRRKSNSEILTMLHEKADVQGYLTTEDLVEIYPDIRGDVDYLDSIVLALRRRGVEFLDPDSISPYEEESEELTPSDLDPFADLTPISSDDTIGLYLKEMSRVPLLSVDEELNLAQRIEASKAAQAELERSNGHTPVRRRRELQAISEDGQLAREHLIKANTRLVVSIAKRYMGQGVPFSRSDRLFRPADYGNAVRQVPMIGRSDRETI